MSHDWQDPEAVAFMLDEAKTWAVVGLSGNPRRTAYSIARLLQERGKRIVPIHPDAPTVLGEQGYASLADVPFPIDVVDVFRRSEFAGEFADQAVAIGARAVFFQLGVIDEEAFERTTAAAGADGDGHLSRDRVAATTRTRGAVLDLGCRPARACPDGLVVPGGRAGRALLPVAGAGWAVGEHHRQPGRARVRRGGVAVASPTRSAGGRCAHLDGRLVGGRVVVVASEHRSQHRNRVAARERLAALLREAARPAPAAAPPDPARPGARSAAAWTPSGAAARPRPCAAGSGD